MRRSQHLPSTFSLKMSGFCTWRPWREDARTSCLPPVACMHPCGAPWVPLAGAQLLPGLMEDFTVDSCGLRIGGFGTELPFLLPFPSTSVLTACQEWQCEWERQALPSVISEFIRGR